VIAFAAHEYSSTDSVSAVPPRNERNARERIPARIVDTLDTAGMAAALHVEHDCDPAPSDSDWRRFLSGGTLHQTHGPFALACEHADGSVTLARDAIGERSLYYAVLPRGRFIYASRLQDILASGEVARDLDITSVATYLTWSYLPGRETLVRGIYKVMPGEVVRFKCGNLTRSYWWSLPGEPDQWRDEASLRGDLRQRLETAVRRRLPAGMPVGATLSGGIDSSLVVALAARLHDAPVVCYSVSFGADYRNELPFSAMVARHCGVEQRIVELSPKRVVDELDRTIALLGDPIGDPLTVPNALLFQEAAREVGVVLNGEGGDPCFGGPKNTPMVLAELFGDLYAGDASRHRAASYLRAHQKCYDDLAAMLDPQARAAIAEHALEDWVTPYLEDPRWKSFVGRLMSINLLCKGAHHILGKVDALSGPFGVLPRAPLFDRDVVELAFAMPPQLKLNGTVEKYLLKEAVRDLLPREIIERPKSGMLVPVQGWFRGPLLPQARERLLEGLAPWGLFRRDYLERLLDGRLSGIHTRRGVKIWLLITLEAWLRGVLKG
jgi:asparagine synthase (glutamine-hydrolysing)